MGGERVVILVGHGAPPRDFPQEKVARLKALEGRRRAAGGAASVEEVEIDRAIRGWPRTAENDPYRAGLEALANELRLLLGGVRLVVAYNEFCAPSLDAAAEEAIEGGVREIVVVPSMLTPGGVHSEVEIPEGIEAIRARHPGVSIRYAWPFDLRAVARMLGEHLDRTA